MSVRRLLIDTDAGIDDTIAIMLALVSPELDLLAITTVAGNCPLAETTPSALRVLAFAGRQDIPVYEGCPRPLLREQIFSKFRGRGVMHAEVLPPASGTAAEGHAVAQLIALSHAARARGEKVTICAIGPLTNLATALVMMPDIAQDWQELVIMGGGFTVAGNRTPYAEFNFLADPHAVRVVLNSGAPLVIVPLDATCQALATPARVAALQATGGRYALAVAGLLAQWDRDDVARFGEPGGPLHDPTTIAYLLAPELFTGKSVFVEVDCENPARYGHVIADWHCQSQNPPNATVMTRIDAAGFFADLTARLAAAV
jgi:purine nucleosidase